MARPHMSRATAVAAAETEEDEAARDVDSVAEAAGGSEGSPPFSCDGWGEATTGADGDGATDGGDRTGLGEGTEAAGAGTGVGGATDGAGDGAALEGAGVGVALDGVGVGVAADGAGDGVATYGATATGVGATAVEVGAGEGLPKRIVLRGAMTTMTSFSPFWQLVALPLMK